MRVNKHKFFGVSKPSVEWFMGKVPANFNMVDGYNLNSTATWHRSGLANVLTGQTAPNGSATAFKIVENGALSTHQLNAPTVDGFDIQGFIPGAVPIRLAVIAKAAERTRLILAIRSTIGGGNPTVKCGFNLALGQIFATSAGTNWTIDDVSITKQFNGYWLCILTARYAGSDVLHRPSIILDNGTGIAAESSNYTGDGTSGALVYYASCMPKAAWSLQQAFFDDFTSTDHIDLNDTRAPGYTWYTHNQFPNFPCIGSLIQSTPPTPANYFSVNNSILTISSDVSGYGSGIMSACVKPGDNSDYIGVTYNFPMILEGRIAYDPAIAAQHLLAYSGSIPALWTTSMPKLLGTSPSGTGSPELDAFEAFSTPRATFIEYDCVAPAADFAVQGANPGSINEFHKYGAMILTPSADTNNRGLFMAFGDGLWKLFAHSWSTSGTYSSLNGTQDVALLLGAGFGHIDPGSVPTNNPIFVDWVRLFQ